MSVEMETAAILSFLALHLDPISSAAQALEAGETYVIYGLPWICQETNLVDLEGGTQVLEAVFYRE